MKGKIRFEPLTDHLERDRGALDLRESVRGLIGAWPCVILQGEGSVPLKEVFAFRLHRLDGLTYHVNHKRSDFEVIGSGARGENLYFGLRALTTGTNTLVFDVYEGKVLKDQLIYSIKVR